MFRYLVFPEYFHASRCRSKQNLMMVVASISRALFFLSFMFVIFVAENRNRFRSACFLNCKIGSLGKCYAWMCLCPRVCVWVFVSVSSCGWDISMKRKRNRIIPKFRPFRRSNPKTFSVLWMNSSIFFSHADIPFTDFLKGNAIFRLFICYSIEIRRAQNFDTIGANNFRLWVLFCIWS